MNMNAFPAAGILKYSSKCPKSPCKDVRNVAAKSNGLSEPAAVSFSRAPDFMRRITELLHHRAAPGSGPRAAGSGRAAGAIRRADRVHAENHN